MVFHNFLTDTLKETVRTDESLCARLGSNLVTAYGPGGGGALGGLESSHVPATTCLLSQIAG